jgi:multicomponent K+:H+ antiporter subunit G
MTLELIGIYAIILFLLVGAVFALVGAIGMMKFNDPMTRLHAPTKIGTVGIGALLLASVLYNGVYLDGSMHEVLIMIFLFVTAPISAHFIAKVNIHKRACETPPQPATDSTWATLDVPEEDREIVMRDEKA